jgi:hypothetical protein
VTATASARDRGFVTGLGAAEVIDYAGRVEDQAGDPGTRLRRWPSLALLGTAFFMVILDRNSGFRS